jgi:hypothetical protein
MPRSRKMRAMGSALRLLLFIVATYAAVRFLTRSIATDGMGPAAVFGLLLVAGAVSLVWRSATDFRRSLNRLRG